MGETVTGQRAEPRKTKHHQQKGRVRAQIHEEGAHTGREGERQETEKDRWEFPRTAKRDHAGSVRGHETYRRPPTAESKREKDVSAKGDLAPERHASDRCVERTPYVRAPHPQEMKSRGPDCCGTVVHIPRKHSG